MKRLLCFAILYCIGYVPAYASDFDVSLMPMYNTYTAKSLDNELAIRGQVGYKKLYLWVGYEEPVVSFGGQKCVDVDVIGGGFGVQAHKWNGFKAHLDTGYYWVNTSLREAWYIDGAQLAFGEFLGVFGDDYLWDNYRYDLDGGIGGKIGVSYTWNVARFGITFNVGYRYLKLNQEIYGWNGVYDAAAPHWEVFRYQSFSCIETGFTIQYRRKK